VRSLELYGYPLANLLAALRNAGARVRRAGGTHAERSAASGRSLQPPERLGWISRAVAAPGSIVQRRFARGGRGHGFVVLAHRG
jgi:hypothetical protein